MKVVNKLAYFILHNFPTSIEKSRLETATTNLLFPSQLRTTRFLSSIVKGFVKAKSDQPKVVYL